jgi:hypothetical protein
VRLVLITRAAAAGLIYAFALDSLARLSKGWPFKLVSVSEQMFVFSSDDGDCWWIVSVGS